MAFLTGRQLPLRLPLAAMLLEDDLVLVSETVAKLVAPAQLRCPPDGRSPTASASWASRAPSTTPAALSSPLMRGGITRGLTQCRRSRRLAALAVVGLLSSAPLLADSADVATTTSWRRPPPAGARVAPSSASGWDEPPRCQLGG
ncbi:MAG: hypothetical protein LC792_16715 [Actinobacteria bacterium]|nr:hypothetical protein [Actinomycetota bacterium]